MTKVNGLERAGCKGVCAAVVALILGAGPVGHAEMKVLAHFDGNILIGSGKGLDFSASPRFDWFGTLGTGTQTVTAGTGQPGFNGALVCVPQAASTYVFFDEGIPFSTIFGSSGTIELWVCPNWSGISQGGGWGRRGRGGAVAVQQPIQLFRQRHGRAGFHLQQRLAQRRRAVVCLLGR